MNYVGVYGNNDYRDYLAHHGVKGMKWGKHLFGNDLEYGKLRNRLSLNRLDARSQFDAAKRNLGRNAGQVKKGYELTKSYLTGKSNNGTTGLNGSLTRQNARATGAAIKATVNSAVKLGGAAIKYGAAVAQQAVSNAIRSSYVFLKQAKTNVINFGKTLFGKLSSGIKGLWSKAKTKASSLITSGKDFLAGAFAKAGLAIRTAKVGIGTTIGAVKSGRNIKDSVALGKKQASAYKTASKIRVKKSTS